MMGGDSFSELSHSLKIHSAQHISVMNKRAFSQFFSDRKNTSLFVSIQITSPNGQRSTSYAGDRGFKARPECNGKALRVLSQRIQASNTPTFIYMNTSFTNR